METVVRPRLSPPVPATILDTSTPVATDTHVLALGAPATGDLLLVLFAWDKNQPAVWPEGWTELVPQTPGDPSVVVRYRLCDGLEGETLTISTPSAVASIASVWRFPAGTFSGLYGVESARGTGKTPTPPALTLPGAATPALFMAFAVTDARSLLSDYPPSYPDARATVNQDATLGINFARCARSETYATIDAPGPFTASSASENWSAVTIGLRGPVPPPLLSPYALIELDWLKLALGIDLANPSEDEQLMYLINMATVRVEQDTHRPLHWREHVHVADGPGTPDLMLPGYPISAVSRLLVNGAAVVPWLTLVDPPPAGWGVLVYEALGLLRMPGGWPPGNANIRVEYAGGYGAPGPLLIPADLQEATVLIAADGYQTRKTGTWNTMSLSLQGQTLNLSPDLLWRRYRSCVNPYRDIPL